MIKFSFNNIGHALASFFKTAVKDTEKVARDIEAGIGVAEAHKTQIEEATAGVTAAVDPAIEPAVIGTEDAAFAVLGAFDAALKEGGAAAEQKFLNAGIDQNAINAVKSVGAKSQTFYALAKSLSGPSSAPAQAAPAKS